MSCGAASIFRHDSRTKDANPKLVVEVQLTTWTRDGRVRHPRFKGMREDKPPRIVKRELPKAKPDRDRP